MTSRRLILAAAAAVLLPLGALAQSTVTVSGVWVRETVPGRNVTAAYATVENPGAADLQIVGASAEVAGRVEMHTMTREGDMMRMSPVKAITVPAKGKVELKPGGLHIMLFDLKRPLKEGETVELTLTTDKGATVKAQAPVKKGMMMQ